MKLRWKKRGGVSSLILLATLMLSYTVIVSLWDLHHGAVEIERKMLHSLPSLYANDLGCQIQSVMMDWDTMQLRPWDTPVEVNGIEFRWNKGTLEMRQSK